MRAPVVMRKTIFIFWVTMTFVGCQHTIKHSKPIFIDSISMATRSEDSFKGIIEAFSRTESKGGRIILRTDPEKRSGLYFSVKFNHSISLLPRNSKIVLYFITNANPKPESATWVLPNIEHSSSLRNEIYLGITDDEHYTQKNLLIAWKLEILHPDGHIIAHKESLSW